MPLNQAERKETLKKLKDGNDPIGSMMVFLDGVSTRMETFEVPLDALIYNPKNGRIRTKVLTYEKRHGALHQDNIEGDFEQIGKFTNHRTEDWSDRKKREHSRNGSGN